LTEEGKAFLPFARPVVEHAHAAFLIGKAIGRGEPRELVVGYSPLVDTHLIAEMEGLVARARPRLPVRFESVSSTELVHRIVEGSCHAGVAIVPIGSKLATACVHREKLLVAMPENHRLAGNARVAVAEFRDEPVIRIGREMHPAACERFLRLLRRAGYTPNVTREAQWIGEALGLVRENLGITFVKESDQRLHVEGVVLRSPVESYLTVETGLAYLDLRWSLLREFVALITAHFRCDPEHSIEKQRE
jgi:DNA-binding transcriptional LysR family regulator